MATSFSNHSRNRYVGVQIAGGHSVSNIVKSLKTNAEGVETTRSLYNLSKRLNVDLPICRKVYEILYLRKDPLTSINSLMKRELRDEF